jgi:hypothetical protein
MIITDIEQKEIDHLTYIKNNPNCNTDPNCLDGFVIDDLYANGYIKGINVTTFDSKKNDLGQVIPEYIDLRITLDGKKYLNKFKGGNFFIKHWKWLIGILIPIFASLIIGAVIVFIFQPWQQNIQENKSKEKAVKQLQQQNK